MKVLEETKSLCPVCLDVIDAIVFQDSDKIHIGKKCVKHGEFKALHMWETPGHYKTFKKLFEKTRYNSYPETLEIFITDKCNQQCNYCFTDSRESDVKNPTKKEIIEKVKKFKGSRIYLIGGEPTVRDDLAEIITEIKKNGFETVLFTNGKKLTDEKYVNTLKESGLDLVIMQFDTFDPEQSKKIRGEDLVEEKLNAFKNLKKNNISIMIYTMIVKGLNEDQIGRFIDFVSENSEDVCILDFNSVWNIGRRPKDNLLTQAEIIRSIEKVTNLKDEDFIQSTVFAYHFFEIVRKLSNRIDNRVPECEVRCYVITDGKKTKALSRIMDMKNLNERLEKINNSLGNSRVFNLIKIILMTPYYHIIRCVVGDRHLRNIVVLSAIDLFKATILRRPMRLKFPGVYSILIGRFHESSNIDLGLVSTCTLHADLPSGKHASFCEREIYREKNLLHKLCERIK